MIFPFILFFPGFKLRRQHWCFLVGLFLLILLLVLFTSSRTQTYEESILNSPALQQAAVVKLLKEVPLIDG